MEELILCPKAKLLAKILMVTSLSGICLFSCRSGYTENEVQLAFSKKQSQLNLLVEHVRKLDSISDQDERQRFSLLCKDKLQECRLYFYKDSSFIDIRESRSLDFQGNEMIATNIDDQRSRNIEVVFKNILSDLEGIAIESLSIYRNDNILIRLNDDQGFFYPLNRNRGYTYELGCSAKTIERMISNHSRSKKPFIFPLQDGWYGIGGILCHGIN